MHPISCGAVVVGGGGAFAAGPAGDSPRFAGANNSPPPAPEMDDNPANVTPDEINSSSSSLPKPSFIEEPLTFSTKKERKTPRAPRPPPRPPAKTCPPVSRVFRHRPGFLKAQSITFLDSPDGSLTGKPLEDNCPVYDTKKKEPYFDQAFTVERKIGEGYFGTVYRVKSKANGELFAVKIANDLYQGQSDRLRKVEEVRKHQFLPPHPNCVHFYQSWEQSGRLYQQYELCQESLLQFSERHHNIPESQVWNYLVDLLLALDHLHDHDLLHMDIKPENIFIGRDGICKLGDFGLMIDLAKGDMTTAVEGDPKYLANEILERQYTKAADVFSLGVTILELASDLELPKHGDLWHRLREEGPEPELTKELSPDMRRVITLMMNKDYERRPTVKQLLELSSIKRARRRRQRQLLINSGLSMLRSSVAPLTQLLMLALMVVVWPLLALYEQGKRWQWFGLRDVVTVTPPKTTHGSGNKFGPNSHLSDEGGGGGGGGGAGAGGGHSAAGRMMQLQGLAFSADEDEDELEFSVNTSPLAGAPDLNDSDAADEDADDADPPSSSPVARDSDGFAMPQTSMRMSRVLAPAGLPPRLAQSTPRGLRYRTRFLARTPAGASPQKRLDFDSMGCKPNLDNSIHSSFQDEDEDSDSSVPMKPMKLADKYDQYYSDSDQEL